LRASAARLQLRADACGTGGTCASATIEVRSTRPSCSANPSANPASAAWADAPGRHSIRPAAQANHDFIRNLAQIETASYRFDTCACGVLAAPDSRRPPLTDTDGRALWYVNGCLSTMIAGGS
jgi:hypothetical protein